MNIQNYLEAGNIDINELIELIPKTKKAAQEHELYLKVNLNGNAKYKNDDRTQFIIWNIPARTTCPYATPECFKKCYAFRSERYPNVKNSRINNYNDTLSYNFIIRMIYTITVSLKFNKKHKKIIFRIHEAGDFYSREYFLKWYKITQVFKNCNDIVFCAYTKSFPYVSDKLDELKNTNFVISLSLWDDSPDYLKQAIKEHNYKYYTAFTPTEFDYQISINKDLNKCNCVNCAKCYKCMTYKKTGTAVIIH